MNRISKAATAAILIASMSACTSKPKSKMIDMNSIAADQTLSPIDRAEQLALAAEALMTPTSFMYADLVLDQALSADPKNKRAGFYKAFNADKMSLKGILSRLKPIATATAEGRRSYNELLEQIPNHAVRTFLLAGPEDIKNEKGIQAFTDELAAAYAKFRTHLKTNKDTELTLNLNDWGGGAAFEHATRTCVTEQIDRGVYEIKPCDNSKVLQVSLNRADNEMLQQMVAGLEVYLAMYTAYDMTGAIATSEKFKNKKASNKQITRELMRYKDFGVYRATSALSKIAGLGIDAIAGVRWAAKLQSELCPQGQAEPNTRKGHLFSSGICISQTNKDGTQLEETLALVESVLKGSTMKIRYGIDDNGQPLMTEIKPAALVLSPIQDLKSLRPVYNECDNMVSVADDTFGGMYPNHDGNEILAQGARCPKWDPTPSRYYEVPDSIMHENAYKKSPVSSNNPQQCYGRFSYMGSVGECGGANCAGYVMTEMSTGRTVMCQ